MADTIRADLPRLALSVRQPWAWAIISAGKDIENRDWPARFRGPVCIHAAKGGTSADFNAAATLIGWEKMQPGPSLRDYQRGGIVGVAEIVGCVDASESPWFFGRYGFVLQNARPVDFVPVKGALGFFDWRKGLTYA